MTNKAHSTLTGSDLHEPKGTASATAGQVYVSNGLGSGTWTDTGATVGSAAFTTGDLKPTFKTVADSGWIMCDDGTIGSASSGASNLASSTAQALYTLIWTNFANAEAAVSTGRGGSAASDFGANKTIALPKMLGRVYGIAGTGAGLTNRVMGKALGEENHTLSTPEIPAHNHAGLTGGADRSLDHTHTYTLTGTGGTGAAGGSGLFVGSQTAQSTGGVNSGIDHFHAIGYEGGGGSHNNMQPTVFLKMMVKL